MKIFRGVESIEDLGATAVAVGSFDGVHLGHSSLLTKLTSIAKATNTQSVVVSFSPHPRVVVGGGADLKLLTSDREKALLLESVGIDALLLIEFNEAFSSLSYEEFLIEYLVRRVSMQELIVGYNHRLGHNQGDFQSICSLASRSGFRATMADEFLDNDRKISSTVIRTLISHGEIEQANSMLIKPYLVVGESDSRGRVILEEPLKLLPPQGEYSVLINGELSSVRINEQGEMLCDIYSEYLNINILKRL